MRTYTPLILVLLLVMGVMGGLVWLPLRLPSGLDVQGQVLPVQAWYLTRDPDGNLIATLHSYRAGAVVAYTAASVARGDVVALSVDPTLLQRGYTTAGDTVGVLLSGEASYVLAQLAGQLRTAEATLRLYETGEKTALIEEARQRLLRLEEERTQLARTLARKQELHARAFLPDEELELAASTLRQLERSVAEAQAHLEVVQTGARPEQVALAQTQVQALQDETQALRHRLARNTFVVPISGPILHTASPDTLLVVADTSDYVVIMPVRWEDRAQAAIGQAVTFRTDNATLSGTVVHQDPIAQPLNGGSYLLVTATVDGPSGGQILPGVRVRCTLSGEALSPGAWLLKALGR
jgi:hypothetical protein